MTDQIVRWHVLPDGQALAGEVSREILDAAHAAIRSRGQFHIVLAGGETPRSVYAQLAAQSAVWSKWRIYFGDERCLPANDPGRNDTMAWEAWLARVTMAPENVLAIPAELGAEQGALRYGATLRQLGDFDLVLLGLGEDGHTASLFPRRALGDDVGAPDTLAVHDAPKPPAERVSLSAARLARTRQVFFLVTGANKRAAVMAWQGGEALPASRIRPLGGVDVFLDAAAMP
ncbi:MAG: 6-phosphogluconolactonase [Acidithiobacillales bacterium SM23_46]|jgi:6-phosphogluconolactonase|nr:MAG: 6-phosphogluconolactonase [Acidithiobacillales bacterium SM23_46]KPL28172.1 MAG: 6-phosphogluconolactonase [Acidithiobacillales bacterium SM1_46]